MCLSCVRGSAARSLAARSRQEKPMFRRTVHVHEKTFRKECSNSEEQFMFGRNVNVEELLIIKIEMIGSVVLFFCGILDAAQPDPDSTSSGPQVN